MVSHCVSDISFFFKKNFLFSRIIDDLWYRDISEVEPAHIQDFKQVQFVEEIDSKLGGFDRMNSFPRKNRCVRVCDSDPKKDPQKGREKRIPPPVPILFRPFLLLSVRSFSDNSGGGFGNGGGRRRRNCCRRRRPNQELKIAFLLLRLLTLSRPLELPKFLAPSQEGGKNEGRNCRRRWHKKSSLHLKTSDWEKMGS